MAFPSTELVDLRCKMARRPPVWRQIAAAQVAPPAGDDSSPGCSERPHYPLPAPVGAATRSISTSPSFIAPCEIVALRPADARRVDGDAIDVRELRGDDLRRIARAGDALDGVRQRGARERRGVDAGQCSSRSSMERRAARRSIKGFRRGRCRRAAAAVPRRTPCCTGGRVHAKRISIKKRGSFLRRYPSERRERTWRRWRAIPHPRSSSPIPHRALRARA